MPIDRLGAWKIACSFACISSGTSTTTLQQTSVQNIFHDFLALPLADPSGTAAAASCLTVSSLALRYSTSMLGFPLNRPHVRPAKKARLNLREVQTLQCGMQCNGTLRPKQMPKWGPDFSTVFVGFPALACSRRAADTLALKGSL